MLVKKALADMAFEIDEAEDGEKGLAAVEQTPPDLILLDVTMPVLDGPGMLERLRGRGVSTPVLLLTAESGTSVIGPMLKQGGVCEYIVKPFKPEQLRAKVIEALQRTGALPASAPRGEARADSGVASAPQGKTFVDVLVVDDMDNVAKKLRTMLPERLTFNSCTDRGTALSYCRERVYRAIILDMDIPDVDTIELLRDLRILQPTCVFAALVMRATKNPQSLVSPSGFSAYLCKPFDAPQVEEFVGSYFDNQDLLQIDGNVMTPAAAKGPDGGTDVFYRKLQQVALDATQAGAAACHDCMILNLTGYPPSSKLQKLLVRLAAHCSEIGIELRVVGGADLAKLLKQLVETASIPVSENLDAAKAA